MSDERTVCIRISRRRSWCGFDRENWVRGVSFLLACCLLGLL